jgi:hypothetical protein
LISIIQVQAVPSLLRKDSLHDAAVAVEGSFLHWWPKRDGWKYNIPVDEFSEEAFVQQQDEADAELRAQPSDSSDVAFSMPSLPASAIVQDGATLTEYEWPANFCVNVEIEAPDVTDTSESIKAIALLGGKTAAEGGTGKCNYFFICFTSTNGVAMGVQCNGGGSDAPLGTSQNLTSGEKYDLRFCYDEGTTKASIYIDNVLAAARNKDFVFPRTGSVSLLVGSHDSDVELTEGVTMTSLTIAELTTTTTTTTTLTTAFQDLQNDLFALPMMPRTMAAQRTATITKVEWPPDFCLNVVVSTPQDTVGVRVIAMVGGAGHCGNFIIYFGNKNTVGMGVQCDTAGSQPALVSSEEVPDGVHAYNFCYANDEKKASISLDSVQLTAADKTWNFPTHGNVSVMVGSHIGNTEVLSGVTLQSLSMVQHNPYAPVVAPTDA